MADEREIQGVCVLGAVHIPDKGAVNGYYARARTQIDPARLMPQNFYYNNGQSSEVTQRLSSVPQASGSIIPSVNKFIDAPMATFIYGGITPNTAHPALTLIQGPPSTASYTDSSGNVFNYNPQFTNTVDFTGTSGDGTNAPTSDPIALNSATVQYPVVPGVQSAKYPAATTPNTTYNIWKLIVSDESQFAYTKNYGPVPKNGYTGPIVNQVLGADGSMNLEVKAQNCVALVQRIFPIAADMVYTGCQMYYPPVGDKAISPRKINCKGGANCGFQLHFKHSTITSMSNATVKDSQGSIRIRWGKPGTPDPDRISQYNLVLVPGKIPELQFYHPGKKDWDNFKLDGRIFGSGDFEVYIHYAGPNLIIGFTPDSQDWDCFSPLEDGPSGSYQKSYYHYAPGNSEIDIVFTNVSCSFSYGPIAFNNYHPENVIPNTKGAYDPDADLGNVTFQFSAPQNSIGALDPTNLQNVFQSHRYRSAELGDDYEKMVTTPSWFGDHRTTGYDMRYSELGRQLLPDGEILVTGRAIFDTTIEGPMFSHIRTSTTGPTASLSSGKTGTTSTSSYGSIIQSLSWGDISKFLSKFSITYTTEDTNNSSYLTGTAIITLENIATDPIGRQILAAIEDNTIAVTLGAGYGETNQFFQGICKKPVTTFTRTGSYTQIEADDILTKLLSDIPFRTVLYFGGMKYGTILDYCMYTAGLNPWYVRLPGDNNFDYAMNTLRLGYVPIEGALSNNVLQGTPRKNIIEVVKPALELVIGTNAIPIMYWDNNNSIAKVDQRYSNSNMDVLKFLGTLNNNATTLLPNTPESDETYNSLTDGLHGVVTDEGYQVTTNTNQLASGLKLYGKALDSRIITYERDFPLAYGTKALAKLEASVGAAASVENTQQGYVGYRKVVVQETNKNTLPDQTSLNIYGNALIKFLTSSYQSLKFSCYITKPLQHYGVFKIRTLTQNYSLDTDVYFYKRVEYNFDKNENLLTAVVNGEKFPSIILSPSETATPSLEQIGV